MNKLITLWVILCIILVALFFFTDADAYTYEGDIDPKTFFTYQPLLAEQLSEVTALIAVGDENSKPQFAVICVMRVQGGVIILAYAYYDEDSNFRHFMIKGNHYVETPFDRDNPAEAQLEQKLKKILNTLRKVSNV